MPRGMPSARANIIAKFIAQMETGTSSLMSTSEPAEATSPARVRISGSPAAAAFLATPAAGYINGINVPVDGGRTGSI